LLIVRAKKQLNAFEFFCGKMPSVGHCSMLDQRFERHLSARKVLGVHYPLIGF